VVFIVRGIYGVRYVIFDQYVCILMISGQDPLVHHTRHLN